MPMEAKGTRGERHDAGAAGNRGRGGGTGNSGRGVADQRHRNRLAEIERVARATGTSATPVGNSGVSKAGRISSALQGMARDYRDVGNSTLDNIGNRLASLMGFNEQRPTMQAALDRVNQTPAGMVTDRRAGWGFDPAGLIGGAIGMGAGIPFGAGFIADQISAHFNRPLEIGMGPSVFGGGYSPFGGGSISTASGRGGMSAPRGGTGNSQLAALPTRLAAQTTASTPAPGNAPAPAGSESPNLVARPYPGYSPFRPNTSRWSWG